MKEPSLRHVWTRRSIFSGGSDQWNCMYCDARFYGLKREGSKEQCAARKRMWDERMAARAARKQELQSNG